VEANYTGRVDISVSLTEFNVTHGDRFVGTMTLPSLGAIKNRATTYLTVPFDFQPSNPDSVLVAEMAAEIGVSGYCTLKFDGFTTMNYIAASYQQKLSFTQTMRPTA
jgi:hypothetical protein